MTDAEATPVALGVRWIRTVPETIGFCALLAAVYVVELLVLSRLGFRTFTHWFVATTSPSPGWLLAALAHAPSRLSHLVSSVALLLVFGGMAERRLSRRSYLGFLFAAGLGGTAGQVSWYALAPPAAEIGGTLGASAIALATVSFTVVGSVWRRRYTGRWAGETTWVWILLGSLIVGRRLYLDMVVGVPGVGRYGHLWGILFGVGFAVIHRDTGAIDGTDRTE